MFSKLFNSPLVEDYGAVMTLMDVEHNTCPGQTVHHAEMVFGVNVVNVC